MNTCPLDMSRITSRGVYCVRPDPTQGIVEMPINGYMVPDPYTLRSDVLPMYRDRIVAHAHRTSPNTSVAIGLYGFDTGEWSTSLGWWFASYGEAITVAESLGSVVYTS